MSNNLNNPDALTRPYYIATHKGRQAAIKRDADYQATIKLVQKSIPNLRSASVQDIFISTTLEDCGDGLILIGEEIWPEIVDHVKNVEVTLEDQATDASPLDLTGVGAAATLQKPFSQVAPGSPDTRTQASPRQASDNPVTTPSESPDSFSVTICTTSHKVLKFDDLRGSTRIEDIKSLIEAQYGVPAALQRLDLSGRGLDDTNSLELSGVTRSKTLGLSLDTRRTMIYLFAPYDWGFPEKSVLKNVEVKLCLDRAWELAALYPLAEIPNKQYIQSVSWTVDVEGGLVDHSSQKALFCLAWEGISIESSVAGSSPSSSHLVKQPCPTSDPSRSMTTVEPDNSVVLRVDDAHSYIYGVLRTNGFADFPYSLDGFIAQLQRKRYEHIALRFLPQAKYEDISPLSVSGCPDLLVVRFVMLYKQLSDPAPWYWDTFVPNYTQGPGIWTKIIGCQAIEFEEIRQKSYVFEVTYLEVP
ncbi:hypothetical protein FRC10_009135 [Ceratobasidium sp. 414]|nr:hypothetical protein FRC10_009135 [Ceratobasidium sp. 414]